LRNKSSKTKRTSPGNWIAPAAWFNERKTTKSTGSVQEIAVLKTFTIMMFNRRSPNRVLEFDQASAGSAESTAQNLPRERRIFQFDEASLNSTDSSSIPTTTASSVRTMTDRSNGSVVEDHPGLNPTDERVVDLQGAIHEEMQRLMIGRDPHEVLAAAERVHGESNDPEFMESQLADLRENGTESQAFQIGGEAVPANPGEAVPANPGEAVPADGDFLGGIGDFF